MNEESSTLTVDYPLLDHTAQAVGNNGVENLPENIFPADKLNAFLDGEDRYADIAIVAPSAAPVLRSELSARTNLLHTILQGLSVVEK